MDRQIRKDRDNYIDLAERIRDIARSMEAREHTPTAIGDWSIGNGYGEGIYVHRGRVWHETGPNGTWAAYSGGTTYERRPMEPDETASLLRRVSSTELEEITCLVHRMQRRM
ncbi:TPA: hypothetical protein HA251_01945 [Candidatus Woesearchaeota archaeon]|nr:hypothetical protein [Candidatus Woesearchaeota archaeon]